MNDKIEITVIVFTKNEALNICDCIQALKDFSEVIVVDSMSEDGTESLATELGAKVVNFRWDGQYPKKRQWSLENISFKNKWIMFVDADERIAPNFLNELRAFILNSSDRFVAGSIPIEYFFAGQRLKHGQSLRKTVLMRPDSVQYPIVDDLKASGMGELEGHYQPTVRGSVFRFKSGLIHNDKDPISTWMSRHIRYAAWEAHLISSISTKSQVDKLKGTSASFFHKLPFRPLNFFIYSYVFKLGFLDGRAGFDYAFGKSWYYWLSGVIAREEMQNVRKP